MGYKYFNFTPTQGRDLTLSLNLIPEGIDGVITIMTDSPWVSRGGTVLGEIHLKTDLPKDATDMEVMLPGLSSLTGKHAIFFKFSSDTKEKSLCTLNDFVFLCD